MQATYKEFVQESGDKVVLVEEEPSYALVIVQISLYSTAFLLRPPNLLLNLLFMSMGAFWGSQIYYAQIGQFRSFYSLHDFENFLFELRFEII